MRIGLFVGSFNPLTKAHMEIGLMLYQKNILDKIIYIPNNNSNKKLISLSERINLLNKFTNDYDYLETSDIMLNYPYYNYEVINKFKEKYHELTLIMGSDVLMKFMDFDNYQDLLKEYNFIIIERFNLNSLNFIKENFPNYQDKFIIIEYQNEISSSIVRENIKNNYDISNLVSKDLKEDIIDLYKDE